MEIEQQQTDSLEMYLAKEGMKRIIEERYKQSRWEIFKEGLVSVILFPFQFIIICLYILVSPFRRCRYD